MKKKSNKKPVKKTTKSNKKPKINKSNDSISKKLDQVLNLETKMLREEQVVEKEEKKLEKIEEATKTEEKQEDQNIVKEEQHIEQLDKDIHAQEKEEEEELAKLEKLESEIKKEVGEHPLRKITFKDIIKGVVGAFVGLAVHYTFTYGVEISENLDMTRASFLFILSFLVGMLFIYATGFRKIKDPQILIFLPIRLFVLYVASIIMSIFVLYIFYPGFGHDFFESYRMVAGVLLAAVVGACTADLIGKD